MTSSPHSTGAANQIAAKKETHLQATSTTTFALYLRHNDGTVWQYQGTNVWSTIDINPADAQIVASTQGLYLRHENGKINQYINSGRNEWLPIREPDSRVEAMAAGNSGLYLLLSTGAVLMYVGAQYCWRSLGTPSNTDVTQIAAGSSGIYALSSDTTIYQYTSDPSTAKLLWKQTDDPVDGKKIAITQIVADNQGNAYQLRVGDPTAQILKYTGATWTKLANDNLTTKKVAANGGVVCRLLNDGTILRYDESTSPASWPSINAPSHTFDVAIDTLGLVYSLTDNGYLYQRNDPANNKWTLIDYNPLNVGPGNLAMIIGLA